jgi:hypothetical protein
METYTMSKLTPLSGELGELCIAQQCRPHAACLETVFSTPPERTRPTPKNAHGEQKRTYRYFQIDCGGGFVVRAYIWECCEVETNAIGQPTRRLERDPVRRSLNAPGLTSPEQNAQNPPYRHK